MYMIPTLVLATAFILEISFPKMHKCFLFQRSGALLTAIYVPLFAIVFGKLTMTRSRVLVDQARIECKELFHALMLAMTKSPNDATQTRIDEVLKLTAHKFEQNGLEETVSILERSTMWAFGIILFVVTIVWGFGDMISNAALNIGAPA